MKPHWSLCAHSFSHHSGNHFHATLAVPRCTRHLTLSTANHEKLANKADQLAAIASIHYIGHFIPPLLLHSYKGHFIPPLLLPFITKAILSRLYVYNYLCTSCCVGKAFEQSQFFSLVDLLLITSLHIAQTPVAAWVENVLPSSSSPIPTRGF